MPGARTLEDVVRIVPKLPKSDSLSPPTASLSPSLSPSPSPKDPLCNPPPTERLSLPLPSSLPTHFQLRSTLFLHPHLHLDNLFSLQLALFLLRPLLSFLFSFLSFHLPPDSSVISLSLLPIFLSARPLSFAVLLAFCSSLSPALLGVSRVRALICGFWLYPSSPHLQPAHLIRYVKLFCILQPQLLDWSWPQSLLYIQYKPRRCGDGAATPTFCLSLPQPFHCDSRPGPVPVSVPAQLDCDKTRV